MDKSLDLKLESLLSVLSLENVVVISSDPETLHLIFSFGKQKEIFRNTLEIEDSACLFFFFGLCGNFIDLSLHSIFFFFFNFTILY